MTKRHVLLVVSKEPITPFDLNTPGIEHCIEASVQIEPGQYITQSINQGIHGTSVHGEGRGDNALSTILSWLSSIEKTSLYTPFRNQGENARRFLEDKKLGGLAEYGPFEQVLVNRDEKNNPVFRFAGKDGMLLDMNWVERTVRPIYKAT